MTVKDIIIEGLKDMGADGLCNIDFDCGCGLDDLEPCSNININECVPARKILAQTPGSYFPPHVEIMYIPMEGKRG